MSAKGGYPIAGVASPGAYLVLGSFVTNGASAPTVTTGAKWSTGAPTGGTYTITLTDGTFPGVLSAWVALEDSTVNANDTVRFGDLDAAVTAGTFTIITASAAGTDAALTGPKVLFGVWLRNTTATR